MTSGSSASPATPMPLVLPDELTIYTVSELRPGWLDWLRGLPTDLEAAEVRGHAVEQVDAAGLQLLVSLEKALSARGTRLELTDPSTALSAGGGAIGLSGWMRSRLAPTGEPA